MVDRSNPLLLLRARTLEANLEQRKLNFLNNSLRVDGENFCFPVPGGNDNVGISGHRFK
jgi:hypothetical protein